MTVVVSSMAVSLLLSSLGGLQGTRTLTRGLIYLGRQADVIVVHLWAQKMQVKQEQASLQENSAVLLRDLENFPRRTTMQKVLFCYTG